MPRPDLGQAAKSVTIAVRVTEREKAALTARYGSPTRALRIALNNLLKEANTND